ncbi:hypothetical protein BN3662_01171 [Clostridiales bacterium CHKCI006]|nr:hypothetical protein BN3662_01171 [Clostridiales bacterium CHKCI006]
MNNAKLNGKDLITTGIYTALYIVALFVASVANVTPFTFMFYPAVASLLGAVFFIMLATKIQKVGAIIIWGIIVGLLYMVLGMGMTLPFAIVGAIIAQIIITKTGYTNFKMTTLAYIIVSVFFIGGYAQLFVTTESYLAESVNRGLSQEFVDGLASYATVPFLIIMIVVSAVFALLGCLLAKKILKKHLVKAGVL